MSFDGLHIVNAEDLKDSDFACFWDFDHQIGTLDKPQYIPDIKSLLIKPINGSVV